MEKVNFFQDLLLFSALNRSLSLRVLLWFCTVLLWFHTVAGLVLLWFGIVTGQKPMGFYTWFQNASDRAASSQLKTIYPRTLNEKNPFKPV